MDTAPSYQLFLYIITPDGICISNMNVCGMKYVFSMFQIFLIDEIQLVMVIVSENFCIGYYFVIGIG